MPDDLTTGIEALGVGVDRLIGTLDLVQGEMERQRIALEGTAAEVNTLSQIFEEQGRAQESRRT